MPKKNPRVRIYWRSCVKSLSRDVGLDPISCKYVHRRLNAEGVTFLTKTLPELSKSVLRSLELGYFDRPTNFAWKGASLRYFTVWLDKIFDEQGIVRENVCPYALKALRQFCEYFYKLTLPFSPKAEKKAEATVRRIEEEIASTERNYEFLDKAASVFQKVFPEICRTTLTDVFNQSAPRYGPGTFAGSQDKKIPFYVYKEMPDSEIGTCLLKHEGISGHFKPYPSSNTPIKLVEDVLYSETLFVPKDSRGPRNISKEPLHLLRLQMAYFDWLSSSLEQESKRRINFVDQSKNRKLAQLSSMTREYATLDLKEASDRVSLSVVSWVFQKCPAISWFLRNARTTHTKLPISKEIIPLKKLSGMGSGLTFPTMALLIYVCILTSVHHNTYLPLKSIRGKVYVYGDDVIVPRKWYKYAIEGLQAAGLMVNKTKSFTNSFFRESCGGDFYNGIPVAPVRLKLTNNGATRSDSAYYKQGLSLYSDEALLQLDRHARELVKTGHITLAEYYYSLLKKHFGDPYGPVSGDSPCLGVWTEHDDNKDIPEDRYVPVPIIEKSSRTCPYKYLGRFFKYISEDLWEGAFGALARPRRLKLKLSPVPGVVRR